MKTVTFAMPWLPNYRVGFYERLKPELAKDGIDIRLVVGEPTDERLARKDTGHIEWAENVPNRYLNLRGTTFCYQPVLRSIVKSDMVIVQQESSLLLTYALVPLAKTFGPLLGVWGHGQHFNPYEVDQRGEQLKRFIARHADRVFAYTNTSAGIFAASGVDEERITVVQNSREDANDSGGGSADVAALVNRFQAEQTVVGWMSSAQNRWKRLDVLVAVLDLVRERVPAFEFVAIGSGESSEILDRAASTRQWLHVLGPRFGSDHAAIGRAASLMIHPGLIGLHVIDSFQAETPIVTEDVAYHSHEFAYLEHGENAWILDRGCSPLEFSNAVVDLLESEPLRQRLMAGCQRSAQRFSLDVMVENFASGIRRSMAG